MVAKHGDKLAQSQCGTGGSRHLGGVALRAEGDELSCLPEACSLDRRTSLRNAFWVAPGQPRSSSASWALRHRPLCGFGTARNRPQPSQS